MDKEGMHICRHAKCDSTDDHLPDYILQYALDAMIEDQDRRHDGDQAARREARRDQVRLARPDQATRARLRKQADLLEAFGLLRQFYTHDAAEVTQIASIRVETAVPKRPEIPPSPTE